MFLANLAYQFLFCSRPQFLPVAGRLNELSWSLSGSVLYPLDLVLTCSYLLFENFGTDRSLRLHLAAYLHVSFFIAVGPRL